MWKLSYTYKDYVGIKTLNTSFFITKKKLNDFIKAHPTITVLSSIELKENYGRPKSFETDYY